MKFRIRNYNVGDMRLRTRFALWPCWIKEDLRWMERVYYLQLCECCGEDGAFWFGKCFLTKSEYSELKAIEHDGLLPNDERVGKILRRNEIHI